MNNFIYPEWSVPACVKSASTTRIPGTGQPPFNSFNLGIHVGDDAATVDHNRALLRTMLNLPSEPQWLNQVHGTDTLYIDNVSHAPPTADAVWTDKPDCVLSVMTADCLPVLLASKSGSCIAAVHGGWRGLVSGILQRTIETLPEEPSQLIAWLGPAIGPQCFEVGGEVKEAFMAVSTDFDQCFVPTGDKPNNDKHLADLFAIGRLCLHAAGVHTVTGGGVCTFQDSRHFFSHRRDAGRTGRMASLIWIDSIDSNG